MAFQSAKFWSRLMFACVCVVFVCTITAVLASMSPQQVPSIDSHSYVDLRRATAGPAYYIGSSGVGKTLRILPLGASIMSGSMTFDENGFRKVLRTKLMTQGYKVNMVGNRIGGTMPDNSITAWGGYRIDEVAKKGELSYAYMPNVILINCGSNDFFQNFYISTAPNRLEALVDRAFQAVPGVMVIVSTLLPNYNTDYNQRFENFSSAVKTMVARKSAAGQRVALADFTTSEWSIKDIRPLPDGTHPTDAGYVKMAGTWYDQIMKAQSLISQPLDNGIPNYDNHPATACAKTLENKQNSVQIQGTLSGVTDDGNFVYSSVSKGEITQLKALGASTSQVSTGAVADGVFWADINGDGLDDYVYVVDSTSLVVALNQGSGTFGTSFNVSYGGNCPRSEVRFGDINADGRDDLFCLSPNGQLSCWVNKPGPNDHSPVWTSLGNVKDAVQGYTGDQIRLGDLDADGRVDYIALKSNGDVYAWRNGGVGDTPIWADMGLVKPSSVGFQPLSNVQYDVRFSDVNGDGRDDLLTIDNNGFVHTLINQRGHDTGLAPAWLDAGLTHNYTNLGINNASQVKFGIVWGYNSTAGERKTDFTTATKAGVVSLWANTGSGGTRLKGDGVRYCDMFGHEFDDLVWMDYDGSLTLFANTHNPPNWKEYGKIHQGGIAPRDRVYLSDVDGDGKCDYVVVSENNGTVQYMKNLGFNQTFSWGPLTNASKTDTRHLSPLHCEWGSEGVRFADISGHGFPDYLCISPNGSVHAWENEGNLWWGDKGYVKSTEGFDRSEVQFGDIDGNGRADYLVVDRFNGTVQAWTNGNNSINTVIYNWTAKGTVWNSVGARGENLAFANLGGYNRADLVDVVPATAAAYTYSNVCPSTSAASLLGRPASASAYVTMQNFGIVLLLLYAIAT